MTGPHPSPPLCNIDDILSQPEFCDHTPERGDYEARFGFIGRALGSKKIGMNITIVPAGKTAFPRHFHYINDEMFVVLAGTGTLHHGDTDHPLRPMDVIYIEAGTGIPVQIENTGTQELRYLALSSMDPADVFVYPDSQKVGVMALATPFRDLSDDHAAAPFRKWVLLEDNVPYWRGEPRAGAAAEE